MLCSMAKTEKNFNEKKKNLTKGSEPSMVKDFSQVDLNFSLSFIIYQICVHVQVNSFEGFFICKMGTIPISKHCNVYYLA